MVVLSGDRAASSSSKNSQHYAPKLFAKHPTAKMAGVSKAALELALERLLADGRVVIGSEKMSYGGTREKLKVLDNEG
jgi:hypothetical protein